MMKPDLHFYPTSFLVVSIVLALVCCCGILPNEVAATSAETSPTAQQFQKPHDHQDRRLMAMEEGTGCSPLEEEEEASCLYEDDQTDGNDNNDPNLNVCVGIRGNGRQLWAHFTALARIVEELGPIDAAAGGSSGSVTAFFLESIQSNPFVVNATTSCSKGDKIRRARISFLLKSLQEMDNHVDISNPFAEAGEELQSYIAQSNILNRLIATALGDNGDDGNTESSSGTSQQTALMELQDFLLQNQYVDLVNPEFIDLVFNSSPDPITHAYDIIHGLATFDFNVDNPSYFVRPVPINLNAAIRNHGIIGNFYAGYAPVNLDKMEYLLERCALPSLGKVWNEISNLTIPNTTETCGMVFTNLVEEYIETINNANLNSNVASPNRLDQPTGTDGMVSLIVAGIIRDEGIAVYDAAKSSYFDGNFNLTWDMKFDDIKIGYWGNEDILEKATVGIQNFDDLKSQKADFLGQGTWSDLLVRSPGEPGLHNGIRGTDSMGKDYISIGGWADLVPAQMLSAIGCENIILITRPSSAGNFQRSVETILGASEEDLRQLNDLTLETSGWSVALQTADGTMCGDYDAACSNCSKSEKVNELGGLAWAGPFVTDDECLRSLYDDAPGLLGVEEHLIGCNDLRSKTNLPTAAPTRISTMRTNESITESPTASPTSSSTSVLSASTYSIVNLIVFTLVVAGEIVRAGHF